MAEVTGAWPLDDDDELKEDTERIPIVRVEDGIPVLLVKRFSPVGPVAQLIAQHMEETRGPVIVRAVGAGAVNQAVKATGRARQLLAGHAFDMAVRPGFQNVRGDLKPDISAVILRCFFVRDS